MSTDLSAYWMPFTDNRRFKAAPRMLVSAEGMYYRDASGRRVLDGAAGLWCVNAGHGRRRIAEAIAAQAARLDYAPSFQMGHPLAFALAARLSAVLPSGFEHVFFTNSGSEAVDTALKMALAFHAARGEPDRTRLVGRERGYHGVGFGGVSVGGIPANRRGFGPLLPGTLHLRHTHDPARAFTRGQPELGADAADDLERLVEEHGAETIAAVIVEPMAGSTGVLPPPRGYLERLRELTRRHGILLIFDEVITGFGRLGAMTASELFGVTPDLVVLAKGLTNGAVPMGAVAARRTVHAAIFGAAGDGIELFHGYTASGHPLAAAAALATLDIFAEEELCARAAAMAPHLEDALHGLRDAPNVVDVRNIGLVGAVELAARPDAPGARGSQALQSCFEEGLLVRVTGDTIAVSPPLIVDEAEVDQMAGALRRVLERLT